MKRIGMMLCLIYMAGCTHTDDDVHWTRLELDGVQTGPVVLGAYTEVIVEEDLTFAEGLDSSLVLGGPVRFKLGDNCRLILPGGLVCDADAEIEVRASSASRFRGVFVRQMQPDGVLTLCPIEIAGGLAGLEISGYGITAESVQVSDCGQVGILCSTLISGVFESGDVQTSDLGISLNGSDVVMTKFRINDCGVGLLKFDSNLDLSESTFNNCTGYAIQLLEHEAERFTKISHCEFSNCYQAFYDKSNRELDFSYNKIEECEYFPFHFRGSQSNYSRLIHDNNIRSDVFGNFVQTVNGTFVNMENNYWFTDDSTEIINGLYDGRKNPTSALVSVNPFLYSEVIGAGNR